MRRPGVHFAAIHKIGGAAKILWGDAACQRSTEIGVQSEDLIDVERVGGDDQLATRIPAARFAAIR